MPLDLNRKSYTEVPETLRPQRGKRFPVTYQKYVKGGFQSFTTMAEALDFPVERRDPGMFANIRGLVHVLSDDLTEWKPVEKGYLTLNPGGVNAKFNIIYPFNFKVMGHVSHHVTIVKNLEDGKSEEAQQIILTGTSDEAVITYEIYKWY